MDNEIIAQMYQYGIWANRKLLDKASALTDEQLRHNSQKARNRFCTRSRISSARSGGGIKRGLARR